MAKKYAYRHREIYKDTPIDVKANTTGELADKIQRRRDQIDRQTIDGETRLARFIQMYLDTYKRGSVSESWYRDLKYFADKIVAGIGNKPMDKIRPMEVQSFLNECSVYSDSTIKKIFDLTQQVFGHAVINGATSYRFDLVRPRGRKSSAGRSLTEAEQDALLEAIKGHRGELFISIMYYCGLRPSEVAALQWKDIDSEREVITVNKALKKDGTIGATKSAAGVREVPMPTTLSALLSQHRKSPFSLVCEQANGYHTKSSLRKMWESIKKDMEKRLGYSVNPCRLYDVRHTYCTNLEKQGVPINIACRLMGHSDISVTSKIYTHASDAALEIARACINGNDGKTRGKQSV
jgi:integrase